MAGGVSLELLAELYSAGPAAVYVNRAASGGAPEVPEFTAEAFIQQFGWDREQVLGNPNFWRDTTHPDDRDRVIALFGDLPIHRHQVTEYRFRHRDGTYRWVCNTVRFAPDDHDGSSRAIGYLMDVTARTKRERELQLSEERYRTMVEHLNEGIGVRDESGRLVYANDSFCRLLGYSRDEMIGTTAEDIAVDTSKGRMRRQLRRREDGVEESYETALRRKDGKIVHAIHSPRALFDDSGRFVGSFAAITDITRRKEAEEALLRAREAEQAEMQARERAEAELRVSDGWLRQIMDNMMDGLVVIDETGCIRAFNPAAAHMFGYEAEEVLGRGVGILMSEENSTRHAAAVERYLRTDERRALGLGPRRLTGQRKDGSSFPVEIVITEMSGENSRAFIGVVRDATEHRLAEEALIRAKQTAEAANRTKSEFLTNVSHELRTPLNAVIGFAEIMKEHSAENPLTPAYRDYISHIHRSGKHLLELINDLLDLSKVESGVDELEEETVDLGSVVDGVIRLLCDQAGRQNISIQARTTDDLPAVRGDRQKLVQILFNLIGNAIKYSRPAGRIWLSASQNRHGGVFVRVSDTGIGMAPERIALALEPFRQARHDCTRDAVGTGLGLPLSKALIELHGGSLEITSELGVGTSIEMTLPPYRVLSEHGPESNVEPIAPRQASTG